jgi:hypothetical protein
MIAIAISLTGQVETKLCNLKCTNHTKEVIRETSPDIMMVLKAVIYYYVTVKLKDLLITIQVKSSVTELITSVA